MIERFNGEYLFLSNFYEGKEFEYKGMIFKNTEAAFHSQKDLSRQKEFEGLRPSESKKKGRAVKLRDDWNQIREDVMFDVCWEKFTQDEELKQKLLNTKDVYLQEGNYHSDALWGRIWSQKENKWIGENLLGKTLMTIRKLLLNKENSNVYFNDFYDAYNFLKEHSMVLDYFGQWSTINYFMKCLDIEVVKVNPNTMTLEFKPDRMHLNTKTQVWLEFGAWNKDIEMPHHDYNLDCGADTFEGAIIKLANLVFENYYMDGQNKGEHNEL